MPTASEWVAAGTETGTSDAGAAVATVTPTPGATDVSVVTGGEGGSGTAAAAAPGVPSIPGPARGPDGKFTAVAQAEAAGATPAQIEALEAWLDPEGKHKLSLPFNALIPRKVNGVESRITLAQALKEHQQDAAFTQNTQRFAAERREAEAQSRRDAVERKIVAAEREMVNAEIDKFKAAQGNPDAMARLASDQERLRTDPEFRKDREDAIRARLGDIRVSAEAELTQVESSTDLANDSRAFINETAAQYPGVDPEGIREMCSQALLSGKMSIGPSEGQFNARTVVQFFEKEAAKLKAAAAPHLAELEGLRKRLEAMEALQSNGKVLAGLRTPTATATSAPSSRSPVPPAGSALPAPLPGEKVEQRARAWVKKGA